MTLPKRILGETGIEVSILGLGTTKLGRNTNVKYPVGFDIPDDKQVKELLSIAKGNGINVIDTAPAYGNSEERLGNFLSTQRKDWIIVSKAGEEYSSQKSVYNFEKKTILDSLKRSLRRLRTDYIDVFLIHSDGNDIDIIEKYEVFNTLDEAKQAGLIRASGMSTKTVDGGLLTLQNSDVAMICYNPEYTDELPVIQTAAGMQKGILIKKPLASGHLANIESLQKVSSIEGISSIIVGTINPNHLLENISCLVKE